MSHHHNEHDHEGISEDELWEAIEQLAAEGGGVLFEWHAPGVEPGAYQDLIDEALAALRVGDGNA